MVLIAMEEGIVLVATVVAVVLVIMAWHAVWLRQLCLYCPFNALVLVFHCIVMCMDVISSLSCSVAVQYHSGCMCVVVRHKT